MPSIGIVRPPSPKKMTSRSLIGAVIVFHLLALPFVIIAICQIRLAPDRLWSYAALVPALALLESAYFDYLRELLQRRRAK